MADKHYLQLELEQLVQQDPKMWEFLQKGSLDGVWYWDLERPDQEWMSPEIWALFGVDYRTKRHDPAEWQNLIDQDDLAVALENFNKHCADPDHPYDQTVRYRHADGSTVWVRCRGMAIRDAAGKPIRMLGAHNDLTAVKLAEQRAQVDKEATEIANHDLKAFAYSISHDMKAPANTLALLLSELQIHLDEREDSEGLSLVSSAVVTVNRMRSLVADVLTYITAIDQHVGFSDVDLNDSVQTALGDLKSMIDDTQASVTTDTLPMVQANEMQMSLLFQNLIGNALKFRRADVAPDVRIECRDVPNTNDVEIIVTDNGIGIESKFLSRVFTMFERLHLKSEYEGNGLGLPLCRRVALSHGGNISVESEPGVGSAFKVRLPRRSA
ncbi:MAG: ATP-binding protein [Burkholderiaceae bacterium]